MATWAYECRRCGEEGTIWHVPCEVVIEYPPQVTIVHVKMGDRWLCARVDRSRPVQIEGMLLREVAPTEASNCSECRDK